MRTRRQSAFTLVELITVMAISAVLLTIIIVPMFQSFQATRTAQAYADAQFKAQQLTETLTKEISDAVTVRDTDGIGGRVTVVVPNPARGVNDAGAVVTPPAGYTAIAMNYTKLDLFLPARVGDRGPGGAYIDPVTGKEDPTLRAPKGQIKLPLAAGTTMRRYWIGLKDPFRPYSNPYDGLLMARTSGADNLYVLYVADVEPVVMVGGNPVVNQDFFDSADATNRNPVLDDPDFFIPTNGQTGAPVANDAKADRIRNWLRRARILTEAFRYDMILPVYEKSTRAVKMNSVGGVWTPRVAPLIQFRPSKVDNDGASAEVATPLGTESDSSSNAGSEVYVTQYGQWSNSIVRTYREGWQPGDSYQIAKKVGDDVILHFIDPTLGGADTDAGVGTPLFNVSAYGRAQRDRAVDPASRYPFSVAFVPHAAWLGSSNPQLHASFRPFAINSQKGRMTAGFGIGEVGDASATPAPFDPGDPNPGNLPQALVGRAFTPANDPDLESGTFSSSPFFNPTWNRFDVNRVFNKVWRDAQQGVNGVPSQFGEVGGAHRFMDLRHIPQGDNTPSPLSVFPNAQIVPGSEEIFGPDQNPGANYGYEVRYRRVNREPGPNEYRINYTNQTEPTAAGYAALGVPVPPATYDPTNFSSAIVQPRFKVGYVQFNSNPETPLPDTMVTSTAGGGTSAAFPGRIRVSYRFQFTRTNDIFRVDYDTRQLMQVLVTVRNYPQASTPHPQTVTMKATANVRNYLR